MYDFERLRRARIFRDYSNEEIDAVLKLGTQQHFEGGVEIFREGEPGRYLYVVLEGVVSIRCGDKHIAKCKEYEAFGEMATLHQRPRSATARAVTPVRALAFGEEEVARLLESPQAIQFLLNIIEVLSARLEMGNAWIADSIESQRR